MSRLQTCAFTGYRPQKLPFGADESHPQCLRLKEVLEAEIRSLIGKGYEFFISGMALGSDLIFSELVLDMKKEFPHLRLIAAIPHEEQAVRWREDQRERYYGILESADDEHLVSARYTWDCMRIRNEWMIDNANYLIAVYDGQSGGTHNTVSYAKKKGIGISLINPNNASVEREAGRMGLEIVKVDI